MVRALRALWEVVENLWLRGVAVAVVVCASLKGAVDIMKRDVEEGGGEKREGG